VAKATFVIAGAGVAAATAADTLRASGFDGRLIVIGREADPPYNRPTLSKQRLRNEINDEQTLSHPLDYYRGKEIELILDREMERVAVAEHVVHCFDGTTLSYDRLLIATGAHLRRLNAPGNELAGIYYLRSLQDCRQLSAVLAQRPRVLVLGTGFIGCEVAASARMLGCEVTLVGNEAPMLRALGPEIGDAYARYHRAQGVDVRIGTFAQRFEGTGRLERTLLFDGKYVESDVAVVGIGVDPSMEIVRNEPVETQDGILVDECCRTSIPNVFAAGDVALSWNPRFARRLRVEHFNNAQLQAVAAAKSMLGQTEPYNPIPSFWSDQYSYNLHYAGNATDWDSIVFRGKTDDASFSAFYLKGGVVQAVCSVNRAKENYAARRLIGARVEPRVLQDDTVDIKGVQVGNNP
jgi:3-phenylpropionate/trans-cinnamate dioxygenase ferredoxin reductase subunit